MPTFDELDELLAEPPPPPSAPRKPTYEELDALLKPRRPSVPAPPKGYPAIQPLEPAPWMSPARPLDEFVPELPPPSLAPQRPSYEDLNSLLKQRRPSVPVPYSDGSFVEPKATPGMDETPLGRALAQAEKLADETLGPLPPQEPLSFNVPSAKPHLTKVVPATTALGKQLYVDSTGKIVEKPKGISDKAIPDVKLYEKDTPRDRLAEAVRFANEHKDWTFREAKAAVNAVYLAGGGKRRGTRPQEDRPSAGQLAHAYFSDKLVGHPLQAVFDTFMAADNLLGWAPRAFLLQWSEKSAARKQLAKEGAKAIDAKATRAWNERTEKNLKALTTWMFESDTDAPMPELWEWSPADAAKITGAPATAAGNKLFAGVANLADLSTLVFGVGFAMGIREHGLNALAKIRKLQAWVAGRGRRVGANEAEARALADEVRRLAEGTPDAVSRLQERLSRALDEEAALGAPKMPTSPEDHFANTRGLPAGPEPDVPLGPGEYSTGHPPTVIDPNAPALPSAIVTPPPPEELARLRALAERGDAQAEALLREWETDQTGRLGLANKSGVQGFETVDVARRAVGRRGSVPAGVTPEARLGVNWEDARSPASAGTETEAFLPDLEARAAGPGTRVVAEPNTPPLDLEAQAALDQRDLERLHGITKKADDLQNDIDEGRPASGEYARPDLAEWVESYRKAQGYRLTDRAIIIEIPQTRLGTQVGYLLSRAFPNSIFNRISNDWSPVGGKTPTWKDVREALKDRRPAAIRDIRESVENLSKLETRVIGDVNAPPLDQVDLGRMPGDVPPVTAGPGAIQGGRIGGMSGEIARRFRIAEIKRATASPDEQAALDWLADEQFGTHHIDPTRTVRNGATQEGIEEALVRLRAEVGTDWAISPAAADAPSRSVDDLLPSDIPPMERAGQPRDAVQPPGPGLKWPWQMKREEWRAAFFTHRRDATGDPFQPDTIPFTEEGLGLWQSINDERKRLFGRHSGKEINALGEKYGSDLERRVVVENALKEGKPVPAEVLAEFSDWTPQGFAPLGAAPPVQPEAAIDTLASLRRQYPNLKAYNAANSTDFTRWKDALEHARSKASELLTGEGGSYTPGWWKPKNPGTTADARAFWDAQEDAIRASRKPPPGSQTKGEKLRYEILDRQGNVKRALRTTEEGRVAVRLGELAAGAPVRAQMMADEAAKQIYGGLGPQGRREFDAYVTAMRNLEITNADYKGPEFALAAGQGRDEARAWVKHVDATGKLGDFEIRRRLLHSQFDNELKRMSDAGLIDDVQVADLRAKGKHYLPRVLLDKIDPAITVPGRPAGTRASLIPALTDKGSAGMVQQDTEFLMRQYLGRMEARIARNKATAPLYDLAVGDPLNGLVQLIKPGKQPPHGWETFGVYVAGKEHTLAMPAKYAREWIGGPPQLNEVQSVWARALSGSSTLKWFATGANPAFALRNIARDMVHIWLSNDQYATFGPLALAQMTGDMAHVALNFRKLSKDYLMEGGGMELLAHQGRATSALQGPLRKLSDALGAPGVASEMLTRLAHRERSMKNLMAEGMNPKEAREVATYMARTRMDFHQGGQAIKAADTVIPYLNAAIQATRGIGREAVVHPAQFVAKVGQLAAVAGYLQYQNNRANPKIMDEIPMRERESYWVILPESVGLPDLKYTDKQGVERHLYFKIAKDQTVRGFASLAEFMVNKEMGRESKHDVEAIVKGIGDAIPVSLDRIPPTAVALLGVMLNKDFYYNEDLWGKDELSDKTLERRPSTAPVYQAWGDTELAKKLGPFGSPIRAQYAVRQIAPSTSYTDLAGAGVRALLPEVPEQFQKDLTTKLLRNPEIRSILGSTRAEAAAIEDVRDMRIRENSRREDLRQKLAPAADEAAEAFGTPDFNRARAQYEAQAKTLVTPGELEWAEGYLSSRVKLKPIPPAEREWYYETSQAPPEVRAILIWQKWNGIASQRYLADQHNDTETVAKLDAELQQLGKNVAAMGGTRSVRFRNQLQALQRKTAAAHFGLTREDVKALSETRYAPRP